MYRSLGLKRHRKPHPSLFELVFFITCTFQGMGAELPHPQPYARAVEAQSRDVNKQGDGTGRRQEQCRDGMGLAIVWRTGSSSSAYLLCRVWVRAKRLLAETRLLTTQKRTLREVLPPWHWLGIFSSVADYDEKSSHQ